jgi:hypothetical protein
MYAGVLLRGRQLTDGTRGDFVVRVRAVTPVGQEHRFELRGEEWEAVGIDTRGRIDPSAVLFQVESGTMRPVVDERLSTRARLEAVSTRIDTNISNQLPLTDIPTSGIRTSPVLVVSPYAAAQAGE